MIQYFLNNFPITVSVAGKNFFLFRHIFNLLDPQENLKPTFYNGTTIQINTRNENERFIAYFFKNIIRKYNKSDLGVFMKNTLKKGDWFIDIGANYGFYSLIAKSLNSEVILFEPERTAYNYLNANKYIFPNLFNIALSDFEGEAPFFLSDEKSLGASSLVLGPGSLEKGGYSSSTKTQVKPFDHFLDENAFPLTHFKLIKIDCEGSEAEVLKGMEDFLKKAPQPIIWCEVRGPSSGRNPNSYQEAINLLSPFGFKPFIFHNNKLSPFAKSDIKQVFDILFTK